MPSDSFQHTSTVYRAGPILWLCFEAGVRFRTKPNHFLALFSSASCHFPFIYVCHIDTNVWWFFSFACSLGKISFKKDKSSWVIFHGPILWTDWLCRPTRTAATSTDTINLYGNLVLDRYFINKLHKHLCLSTPQTHRCCDYIELHGCLQHRYGTKSAGFYLINSQHIE